MDVLQFEFAELQSSTTFPFLHFGGAGVITFAGGGGGGGTAALGGGGGGDGSFDVWLEETTL
jgi:hypothetical protein